VTKTLAQRLGALAAMLAMGFVFWERFRPPPCTGGVFVELHPPLSEPGPYQFRIALDTGAPPCEFSVPLPLPAKSVVDTKHCGMATELKTRVQGEHASIVGLTFGAAPKHLRFQLKRAGEIIYDLGIDPHYTPYPVRREENKRFCGEQAFVKPACVRGSSGCAPFVASCTGPEACTSPKVCCVSPEWGRDYGVKAASECSFSRGCLNRFGSIACHADSDCPKDMVCDDKSISAEFKPVLVTCRPRT
jgi:hypothetical protein